MSKYFGTDGIRSVYGELLTDGLAYKVGRAAIRALGAQKAVIGRDTRLSGESLVRSACEGIIDSGASVIDCGVLPTPAVAALTKKYGADLGVMISASHNPPEYNGIKLFSGGGLKLSEAQEKLIEQYIDGEQKGRALRGKRVILGGAAEQYLAHLKNAVKADLSGISVTLDCAFGAASGIARAAFEQAGAKAISHCDGLRGESINCGCGALYPHCVEELCASDGTDIGFAFDGDSDRMIAAEKSKVIDGDSVMLNLYEALSLTRETVVGTVMTNSALERELTKIGGKLVRTPVGDRHVSAVMVKNGYLLGGEPSGHYVIGALSKTGDGILSALVLANWLRSGGKLRRAKRLELVPQKTVSVESDTDVDGNIRLKEMLKAYEKQLSGRGRIVLRRSGTEPVVRVTVECDGVDLRDRILSDLCRLVRGSVIGG